MDLLVATHSWGDPIKHVLHISNKDKNWHSYTLIEEYSEIYNLRNTTLDFCQHHHFFTTNFCYVRKHR